MRSKWITLLSLFAILTPGVAQAHGIWGHIHVTAWAIDNLPPGELKAFFADPEVRNAALFGAAFTDSGYWPQGGALAAPARAYGEHTHWEPFVDDYIDWMRANDPVPLAAQDSKLRAAFLLGAAAHGLQDEIFDSLFLAQMEKHDNASQEEADPGTDGFLVLDNYVQHVPTRFVPKDVLLEVYADVHPDLTGDVIDDAVDIMELFYVNDDRGIRLAKSQGEMYAERIPWARQNYLNPAVPGSLASEVRPTMAYMQAIWDRLHNRATPTVVFAFPDVPRRLPGAAANDPDSWITFVTAAGVQDGVSTATLGGASQPAVRVSDNRWAGNGWTRVVRIRPEDTLVSGGWYHAELTHAVRIDGASFELFALDFQVECSSPDAQLCPALTVPEVVITPAEQPQPEPAPEPTPEPAPEPVPEPGPSDMGGDHDAGPTSDLGHDSATTQPNEGCTTVDGAGMILGLLAGFALRRVR